MAQSLTPRETYFEELDAKILGMLDNHTSAIQEMMSAQARTYEAGIQKLADRVREVMDEHDRHSSCWDKRFNYIESLLLQNNQRLSLISESLRSFGPNWEQHQAFHDIEHPDRERRLETNSLRDQLWPPVPENNELPHPAISLTSGSRSRNNKAMMEAPVSRTPLCLDDCIDEAMMHAALPSGTNAFFDYDATLSPFEPDDDDEGSRSKHDELDDLPPDFDGVCTVMIKNLPCRCSHEDILQAIADVGFGDEPMSFHVPARFKKGRKGSNLGYAFVSLRDSEVAARFVQALNGYSFKNTKSKKTCVVVPAHQQGARNMTTGKRSFKPLHLSPSSGSWCQGPDLR